MKYAYQSLKLNENIFKCLGMIPSEKEEFYKNHFTTGNYEGQKVIFTNEYQGDKLEA
jgi:hypothetical protein